MKARFSITIFIYLLTSAAINSCVAQELNTAKLDSLFDILNNNNKAMGSLAISLNNKTIYERAIGFSHASADISVKSTTSTKYRIGSLTTMFTAVMIFQLIEENKLSLNSKLVDYFPNIPNSHLITIRDLLYHRSGIYDFTTDSTYENWRRQYRSHDDILLLLYAKLPLFSPGSKAEFSHSNFVLLGYIMELIEKKNYDEILQYRINNKIGLKNTYYGGITNPDNNECYSFFNMSGWYLYPETDMSILHGSGAIVSTSEDLVHFIEYLFEGKLIGKPMLETMLTPLDGYGMGIFLVPFNNRIAYGNGGSVDGYGSNVIYFPNEKIAVSYVSNGLVYPINEIMIGVLSIYFNQEYKLPDFKTIKLTANELMLYTGSYFIQDAPLVLEVFLNDGVLFARATGQNPFPLTPVEKDKFVFEQAGIVMEFDLKKNELTLNQAGQLFLFTRSVSKK